jgi:Delta7-sterol 5-desaturase
MTDYLAQASWLKVALSLFALFSVLMLVSLALGFAVERSAWGAKRRVSAVPLKDGQYGYEAVGNVGFVGICTAMFTAAIASGALRFGPSSWTSGLLTFTVSFFGFQSYYYFLHRAMHTRLLVRFHKRHHYSQVTNPLSGFSMGGLESALWVVGLLVFPMAQSLVTGVSAEGLLTYVVFNFMGNIVGHGNFEPSSASAGTRRGSWLAPPYIYHAIHHARWTKHYGFGSLIHDRLLNTEWSDWPELHARVLQGKPMQTLKDRGDSAG